MYRLFFILISLLVGQSFAADVANLYQSQSPVSSQSGEERQKVAPDVLQQVILKVVGDRSALDTVDLSAILAKTDQFIKHYKYHQTNNISDDVTEPEHLDVLLSFNENDLNDVLTEHGLPIWGHSRPEVLIWVAIEEGDTRSVLSEETNQLNIVQSLNQSAFMRGLPLLFPVMDLQDQSQVTFTDLWADFSETIETASKRYGAPVILMVKLKVSENNLFRADWHARINGESEKWQTRGEGGIAIKAGVEELTDRLAIRFSQLATPQDSHTLTLEINNVKNYSDYNRVINYLANLHYISDVELSTFTNDTLTIDLSVKGDLAVLDRTFSIDRVLIALSSFGLNDIKSYQLAP